MALQALLHGEGLSAASVGAGEGPQLLVEGPDVALQAGGGAERPLAGISRALEDDSCARVDLLVLLQRPGVPEHLAALVAAHTGAVLLLPVFQELGPGVSSEGAALLLAGVASVHFLMSL